MNGVEDEGVGPALGIGGGPVGGGCNAFLEEGPGEADRVLVTYCSEESRYIQGDVDAPDAYNELGQACCLLGCDWREGGFDAAMGLGGSD